MQHTSQRFEDAVVEDARRLLETLVDATPGVTFAVLTTVDGFDIAAHPQGDSSAQRLAAMSSSLQALSEAMINETGLAGVRNLVIESNGGTIIVLGVGQLKPRLSLTVVARGDETLGRLLWAARECCASVERQLLPALG
jgi:uncharacterized protein